MKPLSYLALIHGAYYILTGIWPIINITSFMMVTGPKTDLWLVKTFGVLISMIGLVLLVSSVRKEFSLEIIILAIAVSFGLAICDIIFYALGKIAFVYTLDALAEFMLIACWIYFVGRKNNHLASENPI